jgi:diguanylate cyclase (GGDEF)-like protein/PAS domain S-box-containing protein
MSLKRSMAPTILIIDDSATNRRIYSTLSGTVAEDAKIRSFAHPQEALNWLAKNSADLIVTDYKMPGMTGDQLIRHIRSLHGDMDVPIIVVTAYADRQFRVSSLEAGATDFLLSPVDHIEFVTRARNLLKLRMQQQMLVHRAALLEKRLEVSMTAQEQLLRESKEALAQVIDTVPAMISAADADGKCIFVNALQAASIDAVPSDLVGRQVDLLFGQERAASSRRLDRLVFETGKAVPPREEEVLGAAGEPRVYLTSKVPLHNGQGMTVSVLTTSVDITDRRIVERRLQYLADHDPLTGLLNRTVLRDRLVRELARGRRGDQQFALHFIDLDRFKAINDAQGHQAGDEMLCKVADALLNLASENDTVARVGGDEFAVLQRGVTSLQDVVSMAEQIIAALNESDGKSDALSVGASIGITISPQDGNKPDELLKNSDQAMYSAKKMGGNTWRFFSAEMRPNASQVAQMEAELRGAVSRQEFVLHYQPQIDLRRRVIVGAEALLRWNRPGHGLLRPSSFLGLAEETGLIVPINEWVLEEACRQAATWAAAGMADLRMSVNVSPIQFRRRTVQKAVVSAVSKAGISPKSLDIELTESILLGDVEDVVAQLHALREFGVSLSLDDFGTGYSSLSYVRDFPLDRLKIDRSFVHGVASNHSDLAIVRTIIDLGHILGLHVVAEGVETISQLMLLQADGCDEAQGIYFSEPVSADVFLQLLTEQGMSTAPITSILALR